MVSLNVFLVIYFLGIDRQCSLTYSVLPSRNLMYARTCTDLGQKQVKIAMAISLCLHENHGIFVNATRHRSWEGSPAFVSLGAATRVRGCGTSHFPSGSIRLIKARDKFVKNETNFTKQTLRA